LVLRIEGVTVADEPDMDAPVTRRELREELAKYPTRTELHEALATWAGALEERIVTRITAHTTAEITKHIAASEERMTARIGTEIAASEERMTAEIARHVTASEERIRADMHACFEPHDDVPERVTKVEELVPRVERLEAKVFAPKRASRAPKRRTSAKRR
jgi:hypothetical protein